MTRVAPIEALITNKAECDCVQYLTMVSCEVVYGRTCVEHTVVLSLSPRNAVRRFVWRGTILSVELRVADWRAGERRLSRLATATDGDGVCTTGRLDKWGIGPHGSTGIMEEYGFYDQTHAHSCYPRYVIRNGQEVLLWIDPRQSLRRGRQEQQETWQRRQAL